MSDIDRDDEVARINKIWNDQHKPTLLTIREVAEYLKIDPHTVYRLVKRGAIPAFRVGGSIRFKPEDVQEWLAKQSYKPKEET